MKKDDIESMLHNFQSLNAKSLSSSSSLNTTKNQQPPLLNARYLKKIKALNAHDLVLFLNSKLTEEFNKIEFVDQKEEKKIHFFLKSKIIFPNFSIKKAK